MHKCMKRFGLIQHMIILFFVIPIRIYQNITTGRQDRKEKYYKIKKESDRANKKICPSPYKQFSSKRNHLSISKNAMPEILQHGLANNSRQKNFLKLVWNKIAHSSVAAMIVVLVNFAILSFLQSFTRNRLMQPEKTEQKNQAQT